MGGDIASFFELDIVSVVMGVFIILSAFVSSVTIIEKFCEKIGKPVRWFKGRNKDHELLMETIKNDKELREALNSFIQEVKESLSETKLSINQFTENRIHDRAQSLDIQKELTDSIKILADGQKERDAQITALMCGSKELLGDRIDEKYSRYIALGGIPENEVDEFEDLHSAYKQLNGNHTRDSKYRYVREQLPVIPVTTTLSKIK